MNLQTYIREKGIEEFGKIVGVSKYTARSWMYGVRIPRPEHAQVITKLTPVTYEGIYGNAAVAPSNAPTSDAA